jgi:hypothetical protein
MLILSFRLRRILFAQMKPFLSPDRRLTMPTPTKAPRGTNALVKVFFRELSESGTEADQPAIAKAAIGKINAQLKEGREKAKAAKEKAKLKAGSKGTGRNAKAAAKRTYTRRAVTPASLTAGPIADSLVN